MSTQKQSQTTSVATMRLRIAFFGIPLAALLLLRDGHNIVLAGIRRGLSLGQRRLAAAIGHRSIITDPHRDWEGCHARTMELEPDLLVSWFFTRRIPMSIPDACALGGIGVHPSLLPRHRGPDPFFAAIDAGDTVTGVTVHRLEESFDSGDILAQRVVGISPHWNAWQLARALDRCSIALLRETVASLASGETICGLPQDESMATQAPLPSEEERHLQWNQPAQAIVRRIRALAPHPGALAFFEDFVLVVLDAEVRDTYNVLRPGEAAIMDGVAVVRAADSGVALLSGVLGGVLGGVLDGVPGGARSDRHLGPEEIAQKIASGATESC